MDRKLVKTAQIVGEWKVPGLEDYAVRDNGIVWVDPERMSGTACFTGTRVPVRTLFENLADGLTLDEILGNYPSLTKDAALAALKEATRLLEACEDIPDEER